MPEMPDRVGLGKVVYSVEEDEAKKPSSKERAARAEVEEADKESFPASDPPGYVGGSKDEEGETRQA